MAQPEKTQPVVKVVAQPTDYLEVELVHPLVNCALRDRKAQRVATIRADVECGLKDHPQGVEVTGDGAWRGVIPWTNIKVALKGAARLAKK